MNTADARPLLALTMGDPAGIGPEITVRTVADPEVRARAGLLAVGDPAVARRALETCALGWDVNPVDEPGRARLEEGVLDVLDTGVLGEDLPDY